MSHAEVVELGGLYVVGTERHETRRIDNQLRGRSGRQGDPGETRFYLSGEDDLVRLFAGDRIAGHHGALQAPRRPADGGEDPHRARSRARRRRSRSRTSSSRKNVLKYDDVMNIQRNVIYKQRREVLEGEDLSEEVGGWIDEVVEDTVDASTPRRSQRGMGPRGAARAMARALRTEITADELREDFERRSREALIDEFHGRCG